MTYLELLYPLSVLVALAAAFRCRKDGLRGKVALVALTVLFALSWPPVAWLASGSLEWPYLDQLQPSAAAEAIVVLSGSAAPPTKRQAYPMALESTAIRCRHAAWLYNNWQPVNVMVAGPKFSRAPDAPSVADVMTELVAAWDVPISMIWTESRGGSTYGQAVAASQLLRERQVTKIMLVTEAYHMRRAEACFRKAGIDVVPSACGFRSQPSGIAFTHLLPRYQAVQQNEQVFREWVALFVYWLQGKI